MTVPMKVICMAAVEEKLNELMPLKHTNTTDSTAQHAREAGGVKTNGIKETNDQIDNKHGRTLPRILYDRVW